MRMSTSATRAFPLFDTTVYLQYFLGKFNLNPYEIVLCFCTKSTPNYLEGLPNANSGIVCYTTYVIVDGKSIAHDIGTALKARVSKIERGVSLGVIVAKETPQINQFVRIKERFGKEVGVRVEILLLDTLNHKSEDLLEKILHTTRDHDGLVLQLPIPYQFNLESVLQLFPLSHDVDVLGNVAFEQFKEGNLPFLPPVTGAFDEILRRNGISLQGKRVAVIGSGRLVGGPTALWAERLGAKVVVLTKDTEDLATVTLESDIIFSGTGKPGLITPDMIHPGTVLLDAGSGEMAGVIKGDALPECAEKALLFTPTPGGVGPITVAKVFENLLALYAIKHPIQKPIA